MPSLVLGPLLRHAGEHDATVWVETDAPCTVEVLGHAARTFTVAGHHYALVVVEGLEPGAATPYEVALDGKRVWPLDDEWPPSVIRTTSASDPIDVVFGSCRTAFPHEEPYTLPKDEDARGREICALRALALRMRGDRPARWPGALLMLGDQIYADEVEPLTQAFIEGRRDVAVPPGRQLADFEEYAHAYKVAWGEPAIRWLLSTVPVAMIFDDHDLIDDWNTSLAWVEKARANGWWDERIVSGFMSYWLYQHLGNLPPQSLAKDEVYAAVRAADDGEAVLREFAWRADRAVDSTQWSFCRDLGPARLLMIDSRAGRELEPGRRKLVDDEEWAFIEEHATTQRHDHLLIGTSLPWLLAPGMHHLEAWNEAVCDGAWGRAAARAGEWVRQALDLEHWAAFGTSWRELGRMLGRIGAGDCGEPPATIVALSGDVHHAYVADVAYPPSAGVRSRVYQVVCSPFRNPLDSRERRVLRAAGSSLTARVTRRLARAAGVPEPEIGWRLREEPVFDNVVGTLHLHGRDASLSIERVREGELRTVFVGNL